MVPENGSRRRPSRWKQRTLLALTLLISAAAAWSWFSPVRIGEEQESPDGLWVATAYNVRQGTFFRGRVQFVELTVREKASGRILWHLTLEHPSDAVMPQYGERDRRYVVWAANSAHVTVEYPGVPLIFPVK